MRTVRKQIELAKQERESHEARSIVLRDALEKHFEDLHRFAEKLNSEIMGLGDITYSSDDDLIEAALRQHIPRSPIWNLLAKRQALQQKVNVDEQKLEENMKEMVQTDRRLKSLTDHGLVGIVPGIVALLEKEIRQWSFGDTGHTLKDSLIMEPAQDGLVNPRIGFSHMGLMGKKAAEENMPIVQDVLANLVVQLKNIQEYLDLEKTLAELGRLRSKLREELAVIRLRRIIPGRCKYCPL